MEKISRGKKPMPVPISPSSSVCALDVIKAAETKEHMEKRNTEEKREEEEGRVDGSHGSHRLPRPSVLPELNFLMILYAVSSTSTETLASHEKKNKETRGNGSCEGKVSIGRTTTRRREKNEFKIVGQRRQRFQPIMKNLSFSASESEEREASGTHSKYSRNHKIGSIFGDGIRDSGLDLQSWNSHSRLLINLEATSRNGKKIKALIFAHLNFSWARPPRRSIL
ncbi:hypothetical protein NE237_011943 [Protea cynaroides]|uniref:Uncharacterized protein n=1 Tax=Protea cynaroides TaxID=273540 RepID=A0A9Q0JYE0_9MAGN|nr:hypothetical protein NE237_011943 [Protea cynaroides]